MSKEMEDGQVAPEEISPVESGSKSYDLASPNGLFSLIKEEADSEIKKYIAKHINKIIQKHKLHSNKVIMLYDDHDIINQHHSNKIYEALSGKNQFDNIIMILVSDGGKIEPAYLISKTCKRLAKNKFIVCVPRKAKSAATLIALGATEIHMGLLSELGPIDPQIGGFPALGLANALEKIAALSEKFPASADMFAKYLTANLNIRHLGYFERINESAAQYAQRLLDGKQFDDGNTPESLADHFTNHYKDHGFVIDVDEATRLLGKGMVKESTKEYDLANELYVFLSFADILFQFVKKKTLRYVGSIERGLDLINEKDDDD